MNVTFNSVNFCAQIPNNIIKNQTKKSSALLSDTFTSRNSKGKLSELAIDLIAEIKELFELAHSSIKSIAKSSNTRSAVKNGYERLKRGVAGSRILEFEKIGINGEDVSINFRTEHRSCPKAVIFIGDRQLVINDKGAIEKNPTLQFIGKTSQRPLHDTLKFFTQKEIDGLNVERYLLALKLELKKYIDYIIRRKNEINGIREVKKDGEPGNLKSYETLINLINDEFDFFKSNINKLSYKSNDKDVFRILNKIKTVQARRSILFKDVTDDRRSLYLVYSKINYKQAMKIFLMGYNNKTIDKSFVIYENKLAKFNPKRVTQRPKHLEYDFHYYTQEEIDKSGLREYLNIILDRLQVINEKLQNGIEERLNK